MTAPRQIPRFSRLDRDTLLNVITSRRVAIKYATDAHRPASNESDRPIREAFSLSLNRVVEL